MLELHIHPDNKVIIRENNEIIYIDSVDNFYIDYGDSPELIPVPSWNERRYIQGQIDRLGDSLTQETTGDSWSTGDAILSVRDDIVAAKNLRLTP